MSCIHVARDLITMIEMNSITGHRFRQLRSIVDACCSMHQAYESITWSLIDESMLDWLIVWSINIDMNLSSIFRFDCMQSYHLHHQTSIHSSNVFSQLISYLSIQLTRFQLSTYLDLLDWLHYILSTSSINMFGFMLRNSAAASKRAFSTSIGHQTSSVTYGSNAAFVVGYTVVFGSVITMMHRRFLRVEARNAKKGAPYMTSRGLAANELDAFKAVHHHLWSNKFAVS